MQITLSRRLEGRKEGEGGGGGRKMEEKEQGGRGENRREGREKNFRYFCLTDQTAWGSDGSASQVLPTVLMPLLLGFCEREHHSHGAVEEAVCLWQLGSRAIASK